MKIYQITYVPEGASASKVMSVGAEDIHDALCALLDVGDTNPARILNICPAGDLLIAGSYDYNELED